MVKSQIENTLQIGDKFVEFDQKGHNVSGQFFMEEQILFAGIIAGISIVPHTGKIFYYSSCGTKHSEEYCRSMTEEEVAKYIK